MARLNVVPRNQPRKFDFDELFFSTTDHKGTIVSGNEVFARVAGYDTVAEMIGKPHNIIRHPDMPRAVFKLMWEMLNAGEPFAGYVKNMATDGCYYWVMALVVPIYSGFLSVRFKPSSPYFALVQNIYAAMLACESETHEGQDARRIGMDKSTVRLNSLLAEQGFASYVEFMRVSLATEMEVRRNNLLARGEKPAIQYRDTQARDVAMTLQTCLTIERQLNDLFSDSTSFLKHVEDFDSKATSLRELAHKFHLVSFNGIVSSSHLNGNGQALAVVTQNLAEIAKTSKDVINEMISHGTVTSLFRNTSFTITSANVQVEMAIFFARELLQRLSRKNVNAAANDDEDKQLEFARLRQDLDTLVQSFAHSIEQMLATLPKAQESIALRVGLITRLTKILQTLSIASVAGKVQAVQAIGATSFLEFFEEVDGQIRLAKKELSELDDCIPRLQSHLPYFEQAGGAVENALQSFGLA